MSHARIAAVLLLSSVTALSGCVTSKTYKLKEQEAATLASDLNTLRSRYQQLQTDHAALQAEKARLEQEVARLQGESTALAQLRDKLQADNRSLDAALKAKSDSLSKALADQRDRNQQLDKQNSDLTQQIAVLTAQVAALQKAKEEEVQKNTRTYEELLTKMKDEISQGQVTISELKGKLTVNMVDAVLFDSGKAEVKPDGLRVLQKVVDILKNVRDKAIRVEGHTDNQPIGSSLQIKYPSNWELSAARAINVTRYLQQQGIDPAMLGAVAYGEYKPVAANDTPEGKAKNRRIEIILVPRD